MRRAPSSDEIALSPGERVRRLAARTGENTVAAWCAELLSGRVRYDDPARPSIKWLGGRSEVGGTDYWPRVWGARGLLYVWHAQAESTILAGLHDPAWRVREMCAKVARKRRLASAEAILTRLLDDPVPRVRVAAEAALTDLAQPRPLT